MYADTFEILMMVAFGTLVGTGVGLVIGFVAKKQKREWSAMTRQEHGVTIALIIMFWAACTAVLDYYLFM
jgi:hypothetical protein